MKDGIGETLNIFVFTHVIVEDLFGVPSAGSDLLISFSWFDTVVDVLFVSAGLGLVIIDIS